MRIKQIYITKEGEPMANPYMEYPKKPSKEWDIRMGGRERNKIRGLWKKYENRLNKYHSGLLPFEDREMILNLLSTKFTAWKQKDDFFEIKPDGLMSPPIGERSGSAKLTESDVLKIRSIYLAGGISQSQLGKMFGVTQTNILRILKKDTWAHI